MADDTETIVVSSLNLGVRGKRLFNTMRRQYPNLDPIQTELLVEACRIADQLERLHNLTRGEASEWAFVRMPRNKGEFVLQIDDVVSTQRQLQLALKTITATLTVAGGEVAQPKDGSDDLARRREERRAAQLGRPAAGDPNP